MNVDIITLQNVASAYAIPEFVAGAVGGMFGKLIDYPADTVKTRLQTEGTLSRGPLHCAREILRESGIAGFYRGIPTPLICAVTECATMFSSWAMCCNLISGKDTTEANLPDVYIAGAMSGFFVAPFVTPLELIKCKMQHRDSTNHYRSAWHCFRRTLSEGGVRSLYRGNVSTLVRDVPALAVFFGAYETLLRRFDPERSSGLTVMIVGSFAGMISWASSFPADVVKSQQQTGHSGSFVSIFSDVWRRQGVRGIYSGMGITLLRAIPANAAIFLSYELLMQAWHKHCAKHNNMQLFDKA